MLRIEHDFGAAHRPDSVPISEAVRELSEFDGELETLERVLGEECARAHKHVQDTYSKIVPPGPRLYLTVGFLQGVTFAAAVRNVNDRRQSPRPETDEQP